MKSKGDFVLDLILRRFEEPDETRAFEKGKFELVHIGGMVIGRATYDPGWRWSTHIGASLQKKSCDVEHVGLVVSGRAAAAMDDGRVVEELRQKDNSHPLTQIEVSERHSLLHSWKACWKRLLVAH